MLRVRNGFTEERSFCFVCSRVPDFLGYRHGGALDFVFLLLSYVHLDVITFGIVIRPVLKHGPRSLTYVRVLEL